MSRYRADNFTCKTWKTSISMAYHDTLSKCVKNVMKRNKDQPEIVSVCEGILDEGQDWINAANAITSSHLGARIMFFHKDSTEEDVVHECMHAVAELLRDKGCPLSPESEEAYCYLMGRLSKKTLKFLRKSKQ